MSNEDDFVDIEELEDNNPKEINEETNIQTTQEKNKIEENNNFDFNDDEVKIEEEDINKNKEYNNIDDDKNNNLTDVHEQQKILNDINNNVNMQEQLNDKDLNQAQNDQNNSPSRKEKAQNPASKKRKTTNRGFDNSIHVHNPVPLSKLQQAENKYYKIREELNKKFFNNENQEEYYEEPNEITESKKNKEMISYLEQLNDVLTEILKSNRVQQKEKEKLKKKTVQKTPDQIYQEQMKMNDNQEKIIEVYKKQLATLQSRVKQVSQPNFLEDLIEKNKKLDEEIQNIQLVNKKLNNEQKLNEIVISKQNKNENEDKANMNLKRMNMDYSKIIRENDKLTKRIEEYKRKEVENESKIKQLQEFVDKLHTIAKDMYNITDYENVKSEEKKEKQKEESKIQYKKRIDILKKKKESNINKYGQELMLNNKQIDKLQKKLIEVEKELQKEEDEKDLRLGITRKKENKNENAVVEENKVTKEKENEQYQNNELVNNNNIMYNNNTNQGINSRKNSGLKRCKEGIYQELGNEDNLNINMNKDTNEINNSGNAKEIFDAKDLSNINPMNEMSVEVPFVENEDKKNKKPAFLEGFEDDENEKEKENHEENEQKEKNNQNENIQKNDKGENVEKKENENRNEEKEEEKINENKNEENANENIENNIIRVDQFQIF